MGYKNIRYALAPDPSIENVNVDPNSAHGTTFVTVENDGPAVCLPEQIKTVYPVWPAVVPGLRTIFDIDF